MNYRIWNGSEITDTQEPASGDVVLQATGLVDVLNCDIYECDIVDGPKGRFVVERWEDGFRLVGRAFNCTIDAYEAARLEVVGNAFENPDML